MTIMIEWLFATLMARYWPIHWHILTKSLTNGLCIIRSIVRRIWTHYTNVFLTLVGHKNIVGGTPFKEILFFNRNTIRNATTVYCEFCSPHGQFPRQQHTFRGEVLFPQCLYQSVYMPSHWPQHSVIFRIVTSVVSSLNPTKSLFSFIKYFSLHHKIPIVTHSSFLFPSISDNDYNRTTPARQIYKIIHFIFTGFINLPPFPTRNIHFNVLAVVKLYRLFWQGAFMSLTRRH